MITLTHQRRPQLPLVTDTLGGRIASPLVSHAAEMAETFADLWVDEVRRLVRQEREIRQKYEWSNWAVERNEEWSPQERDLHELFGRMWTAQHHLVWAAHQLERWQRRLARERGLPEPAADAVLADLRNALEHLDEAVLGQPDTVAAGENPSQNRSLRRLPGSELHVGPSGTLLFHLVDPKEIEKRAFALTTASDREMEAFEDWIAEYGPPDLEPTDEDE